MVKQLLTTVVSVGAGLAAENLVFKQADDYIDEGFDEGNKTGAIRLAGTLFTSVAAGLGAMMVTVGIIANITNRDK